jgi:hypothetical protein
MCVKGGEEFILRIGFSIFGDLGLRTPAATLIYSKRIRDIWTLNEAGFVRKLGRLVANVFCKTRSVGLLRNEGG